MYTLKRFLNTHRITRETFDQLVAKDKDFFDRWIEPGETEETITIAPRAVDRLEEILEDEDVPRMSKEEEKEVDEQISMEKMFKEEIEELDKLDIDNMQVADSTEEGSPYEMEMETIMPKPVEPAAGPAPRKRKKKEDNKPRRRRGKNTLTKEFIAEHGQADGGDIKSLRMFLMNDGLHKAEDVALMTDTEVQEIYKKDYFVISTETETYIFPRTLLNSVKNEVYVVEK